MSYYKARTISLAQLTVTTKGLIRPLCNSCKNKDCENPIEEKEVWVFGFKEQMKCYCVSSNIDIVINCDGYVS